MNKAIILLALILLYVKSLGQIRKGVDIADHYQTAKFDVVIFPKWSQDIIPGIRFTPTRADIDKAETALGIQLKELNTPPVNQYKSPIIHKKLNKYRRQYFGYLNQKGQKVLLINSFWNKKGYEYWLESKISVLDGGSYYWSINYDLETDKLFDFYINGGG